MDLNMNTDGIILLAKKTGITSFTSLNSVKKALNTKKVGHTGTLDSFAKGLLVVCTGRMTKLAGNIVEFDKTYRAVIKFGQETDSLEYTGKIVKEAPLPDKEKLLSSIEVFKGEILQTPPVFSAIHVDGKRASDLVRQGKQAVIPPRKVTVYSSKLIDLKLNNDNKVEYALMEFSVSKGTYIRSLARDIGIAAGSAAHLIGLYRTRVGNFKIENAAGYSVISDFSIKNAIYEAESFLKEQTDGHNGKFIVTEDELKLQEEIRNNLRLFDKETALQCGFSIINIVSAQAEEDFKNGKPLKSRLFDIDLHTLDKNSITAVFNLDDIFLGLIAKDDNGKIHYRFVCN